MLCVCYPWCASVQADWERDAKGASTMGYRQFFDAFFELADIWCPDIDGGQYANFLDTLRTRLSVMVVQKKDGSVLRKLVCAAALPFPPIPPSIPWTGPTVLPLSPWWGRGEPCAPPPHTHTRTHARAPLPSLLVYVCAACGWTGDEWPLLPTGTWLAVRLPHFRLTSCG